MLAGVCGRHPIRVWVGRWRRLGVALALALGGAPLAAQADPAADRQAICQTIGEAAAANGLPFGFLARLLWTESGFRSAATSPAGAEGVAQFMPQTAAERGLLDPRDPLQAIGHAARLLLELDQRFGNLGLAAAAYNAGPARVTKWLLGLSPLPIETRLYVLAITGRNPEDWATLRGNLVYTEASYPLPGLDCLNANAGLARRAVSPLEAPARVYQARLDRGLASATALFDALSHGEAAAHSEALVRGIALTRYEPAKPLWLGQKHAADSLCAMFRAEGAKCEVGGR
jgi:Transglycosylase SLT domain